MANRIVVPWLPQPRQKTYLQACGLYAVMEGKRPQRPVARVIGYGGAAGGGKSDSLVMTGILGGLAFPGISIGYFRREYPQLEGPGGAIMRSQELMSSWAKWNGSQRRWTMPTGSILQFCHAKSEDDVFNYQSQQFDIMLFDEATQFTRFQYRYLLTRNRATRDGVVPFAALGTNPGNIGHAWFKKEFVKCGQAESVVDVEVEPGQMESHIFIPAKLEDNQKLEQRDPQYRKTLEAQPEKYRRMLLHGDWDVFAGQFFDEWLDSVHVVKPFPIPQGWLVFGSFDWGSYRPYAYGDFAVDYDGRMYMCKEVYGMKDGMPNVGTKETPREIAVKIKAAESQLNSTIAYRCADPSIWKEDGGPSIAEDFVRHGIVFIPADNTRTAGWNQVRNRLKHEGDNKPMLQVFSTCVNTIRTVPEMIHDKHRPDDLDSDGEDHISDIIRYASNSRPWTPTSPAEKQKRERQRKKKMEKRSWMGV